MKAPVVFALLVGLSGCGGSGSDSASATTATANGLIAGRIQGGFSYGDARIYSWNGEARNLLASTSINRQGQFEVGMEGVKSQPLLIVARGGYVELADGRFIEMTDNAGYRSLLSYEAGAESVIPMTFHSSLVAGLAERNVQLGVELNKAIEQARDEVSQWLTFDPETTIPIDIRSPELEGLSDEVKYGFIDGAVSQIAAWAFQSSEDGSSVGFVQTAYKDVRADGFLDGIGESGQLLFGGSAMSVERYRQGLALGLLSYASGDQNATTIDIEDLLPFAQVLNESQSSLFAGEPVAPLDLNQPEIAGLSVEDQQVVAGVTQVAASIVDVVGIEEVSLFVNGSLYEFAGPDESPEFTIDTTAFIDGDLEITLRARNYLGAVTEETAVLVVANQSTVIDDIRPFDGQIIGGDFLFSADVSDPGGIQSVRFDVNEASYFPNSLSSPSVAIDTVQLTDQDQTYSLDISVTSGVGATTTETVTFDLDNVAPNAEWNLESTEVATGSQAVTGQFDDNTGIDEARLYVEGDLVDTFNSSPFSTSIDTKNYEDGMYLVTLEVVDRVGNATMLSKNLLFDNTPPEVRLSNPLEGDVITTSFNIVAFLEDAGGVQESVIYLVDGVEYSTDSPAPRVSTELNVNNYSNNTNHTISVSVTDRAGFTTVESATVFFDY